MQTDIQLIITPEEAAKENLLKQKAAEKLAVDPDRITEIRITRKSIDARSYPAKINIALQIFLDEKPTAEEISFEYQQVAKKPAVIIVGAGPSGLFAALKLLKIGVKPILIDRGKEARERKMDIAQLNRNQEFNSESNYCFGEGGAGTFSDGKLYTRSRKKGNVREILETFHFHGAHESVLYESHPHIGSDLLPNIVESIRKTILNHGGDVHYNQRVTELIVENDTIKGCRTANGSEFYANALILATGHSSHEIFEMLHEQGVELEGKGFAMGVRVEHPQTLIDKIQYHSEIRSEYLPAASYSLVEQVDGRAVYSFCMCPGGHIVPAGTMTDSIVVNGMSSSKRNSPYANSGIVVEIQPDDIPAEFEKFGVLKGLKFQQHIEKLAFSNNGGKGLTAPAQRLIDFVNGRLSADLPECSYLPGIVSSPIHFWLPELISLKLREAFKRFDLKMRGYLTNDAVILGVETRSSSPVRIVRDHETLQHIRIKGLFPVGEGSGYSGGITSSAIDGENSAVKAAEWVTKQQQ
ncbi:MAG: FAD-binding protein [Porphyromonadaceae bacterium]|nr:FAD-binding protein [Porphyromonadaceae bacterium]